MTGTRAATTGMTKNTIRVRSEVSQNDVQPDGTYEIEFQTAGGESLMINVPVAETRVLKHFQKRMPYGLFVPDVEAT